jgi:hypothetical protein
VTNKEEWYAFADRLIPLAYAIFGEAKIDITEKLFGEPKILSWRSSAGPSETSKVSSSSRNRD